VVSPDSALADPSCLALAGEESLTLRLAPVEGTAAPANAGDEPWHLVLRRSGSASPARRGPGLEPPAPRVPAAFALHPNRPNPFRGSTTLGFDLPTATEVRLEVFDLAGRRVRTLARGGRAAGSHVVEWDRRDEAGRLVPGGVYLYRLQAGAFRAQQRMVLMP
jgi:hypothetical protein